jgi:hypothetical protein
VDHYKIARAKMAQVAGPIDKGKAVAWGILILGGLGCAALIMPTPATQYAIIHGALLVAALAVVIGLVCTLIYGFALAIFRAPLVMIAFGVLGIFFLMLFR